MHRIPQTCFPCLTLTPLLPAYHSLGPRWSFSSLASGLTQFPATCMPCYIFFSSPLPSCFLEPLAPRCFLKAQPLSFSHPPPPVPHISSSEIMVVWLEVRAGYMCALGSLCFCSSPVLVMSEVWRSPLILQRLFLKKCSLLSIGCAWLSSSEMAPLSDVLGVTG